MERVYKILRYNYINEFYSTKKADLLALSLARYKALFYKPSFNAIGEDVSERPKSIFEEMMNRKKQKRMSTM
jgi:hypothetical protein